MWHGICCWIHSKYESQKYIETINVHFGICFMYFIRCMHFFFFCTTTIYQIKIRKNIHKVDDTVNNTSDPFALSSLSATSNIATKICFVYTYDNLLFKPRYFSLYISAAVYAFSICILNKYHQINRLIFHHFISLHHHLT